MEQAIQHGADVIIRDWVRLRAGERILIVSSQKYAVEVAAMQQAAQAVGSVADVLMLDDLHEQVGQYFDDREDAFDPYNAVIGLPSIPSSPHGPSSGSLPAATGFCRCR